MSVENGVLSHAWYLAGPMTGYEKFNFPLFYRAAKNLRYIGYNIISPAELDQESTVAEKAMASESGDLTDAGIEETWGDLLSRDVKIIADKVGGIIFLPDWPKSRGARLEAFVGILCGHSFGQYWEKEETNECGIKTLPAQQVLMEIYNATK